MTKKISLLCLIILCVSCASVEKHNLQITKLHPVADLHEDINKFYTQLKRHHPHIYQFTSKETLDFKFDSLKTAINKPVDSRTFFMQLAAVKKQIGQGHITLRLPEKRLLKKERKALKDSKFDIDNLDYEYLNGKLWIVNARGKDSILIGSEVVKVNEETPQELITKYKKIIGSDGYNKTRQNRAVGRWFMGYYRIDKGRFDSITLTLKNSDSIFVKKYRKTFKPELTKVKSDSTKTGSNKKKLTKEEKRVKKTERKALKKYNSKYGYIASRKEYTRNLNFVGKDSSVAVLKIRGFTNGKYKEFYAETFAEIDKRGSKALIIDLRDNGGGRLKEITHLYTYLTNKIFKMVNYGEVNSRMLTFKVLMSNTRSIGSKIYSVILSPIIITQDLLKTNRKGGKLYYKFSASKEKEPNLLHYRGPIYVLINGNSFSASSTLSTQLQGNRRATLVGEETGGAYNGTVAGQFKIYELPNTKIRARIGLIYMDTPFKVSPDGYGVRPDIEILPTVQDRLEKRDPELEWVLKEVKSKKSEEKFKNIKI
ncbi:peptidase S41 [Flavobacteriaceae bacterium AU392]|nr:peptidase S41 [Flavobacteriaceae bacterium]RKM85605.1 peptidase S41 [Flavobacteriaceae bacterium AU392]